MLRVLMVAVRQADKKIGKAYPANKMVRGQPPIDDTWPFEPD